MGSIESVKSVDILYIPYIPHVLSQYCNEVDWITMLWYKEGKKVQRGSVYK